MTDQRPPVLFLGATDVLEKAATYCSDLATALTRRFDWELPRDGKRFTTVEIEGTIVPRDADDRLVSEKDLPAAQKKLAEWAAVYEDEDKLPTEEAADAWLEENPPPLWYFVRIQWSWFIHDDLSDPMGSASSILLSSDELTSWVNLSSARDDMRTALRDIRPGEFDPFKRTLLRPL